MLASELRLNIDEKWENCWPSSSLKPIAVLDLISFLFFLKRVDELQLVEEGPGGVSGKKYFDLTGLNYLVWDKFKDLGARDMHEFFTMKNGVVDLIRNLNYPDFPYGVFLKGPLLLTPTSKLLINAVEIIKIIEAEDDDTKAAMSDYLLNKASITGQNGQVYLPEDVGRLMVSIIQPTARDLILDPSAGNGSLLVNSARYITNSNPAYSKNFKNDFNPDSITGLEADYTNLRIGAMNMVLHGIRYPKLGELNVFPPAEINIMKQPTLILANLLFVVVEDKMTVEGNSLKSEATKKETLFLNLILKNLKRGARAIVIVPEIILYGMTTEIKAIRQNLVDTCKLEAVISLSGNGNSFFHGAAILVFARHELITTDKVWFYKVQLPIDSKNKKNPDTGDFSEYNEELVEILSQWKSKGKGIEKNKADESFYITAGIIKANNYNLLFSEYKMLLKKQESSSSAEVVPAGKRITATNTREPFFPDAEKISAPKKSIIKKIGVIILVSIAVIGLVYIAFFFINPENKNTFSSIVNNSVDSSPAQSPKAAVVPVTNKEVMKNSDDEDKAEVPPEAEDTTTYKKYTVLSKAYFYLEPDERTKRSLYINDWSNAILEPMDEKNGFVYVVYVNKKGQSTRGWLNKKDLSPVK